MNIEAQEEEEEANPIVRLEPDSLYITTSTLILIGKWHWTLIATGPYAHSERNTLVRHEWAPLPGHKHQSIGPAEQHLTSSTSPRVYTNNAMTLCYLKVQGYVPQSLERVGELCEGVFPASYNDVRSNRRAGFTCRTFALKILKRMVGEGVIVREDGVAGIEARVKELSEWTEEETSLEVDPRTYPLGASV